MLNIVETNEGAVVLNLEFTDKNLKELKKYSDKHSNQIYLVFTSRDIIDFKNLVYLLNDKDYFNVTLSDQAYGLFEKGYLLKLYSWRIKKDFDVIISSVEQELIPDLLNMLEIFDTVVKKSKSKPNYFTTTLNKVKIEFTLKYLYSGASVGDNCIKIDGTHWAIEYSDQLENISKTPKTLIDNRGVTWKFLENIEGTFIAYVSIVGVEVRSIDEVSSCIRELNKKYITDSCEPSVFDAPINKESLIKDIVDCDTGVVIYDSKKYNNTPSLFSNEKVMLFPVLIACRKTLQELCDKNNWMLS